MVVDAWMQHPTPGFLRHPAFASLWRWTGTEPPAEAPPIDATVEAMDAAGVDVGVLSAWHGPEGVLIGNDEVAGWCAAHPARFRGLCATDLRDPAGGVREVRRCVTELGFVGVRYLGWLWEAPPTDRRVYPLAAACVELGVPLCLQVGHTGPLRPSETGRPIPYVDQLALDFPELTIVCGHIGYPWTEEMVAVARKHERVLIDTSAYTVRRYPEELRRFLATRTGARKVLFGTNWPMIAPQAALEGIDELELADRAAFLGDNAARVFGL
jgi:uncharacterized protein